MAPKSSQTPLLDCLRRLGPRRARIGGRDSAVHDPANQNAGSAIATFVNYGVLNCSTGITCTASGWPRENLSSTGTTRSPVVTHSFALMISDEV